MAATLTSPTTTTTETAARTAPVLKQGLVAGAVAGAATVAIVAVARAFAVPVETAPGEAIPLLGFAQMTLLCAGIGIFLARVIGRRAAHPRALLTKVTVGLTALSLLPDLALSTDGGSKAVLVATHLVAAAIVIPVLVRRLPAARPARQAQQA